MKLLKKLLFIPLILLVFIGCEDDLSGDSTLSGYVGVEASKIVDIPKDATINVETKVVASDVSNTDRVFELIVQADRTTHMSTYYSVPNSVTIPAGSKEGTYITSITGSELGGGKTLYVTLKQVAGTNTSIEANSDGDDSTLTGTKFYLTEECLFTKAKLTLDFDNYPEESAWELYDSNSNLVTSGGLNGSSIVGYPGETEFVTFLCLPSGSYTFVMYDAYGDGMYTSATNQGSYTLELLDGTVLVTGGGNFGSFQDQMFTIQ